MKNLKKISREQLKGVKGAGPGPLPLPICPVGYYLRCEAIGVCAPEYDQYDCACQCIILDRTPR